MKDLYISKSHFSSKPLPAISTEFLLASPSAVSMQNRRSKAVKSHNRLRPPCNTDIFLPYKLQEKYHCSRQCVLNRELKPEMQQEAEGCFINFTAICVYLRFCLCSETRDLKFLLCFRNHNLRHSIWKKYNCHRSSSIQV